MHNENSSCSCNIQVEISVQTLETPCIREVVFKTSSETGIHPHATAREDVLTEDQIPQDLMKSLYQISDCLLLTFLFYNKSGQMYFLVTNVYWIQETRMDGFPFSETNFGYGGSPRPHEWRESPLLFFSCGDTLCSPSKGLMHACSPFPLLREGARSRQHTIMAGYYNQGKARDYCSTSPEYHFKTGITLLKDFNIECITD